MRNKFKILDCTLRDGSYANNFSFTQKETHEIINSLDKEKIDFIEIGHGIGLGADKNGFAKSRISDEENMQIAASSIKESTWGIFCIPGITQLSDIDKASKYNMDFILRHI